MTIAPDTLTPATPPAAEADLASAAARLDTAVAGLRELDPLSRAIADEFALALDQVSRSALTTMVRRLKADPRGTELLFELVDDPEVRMLLGMYGIIRLPDPAQAEQAASGRGADGSVPAPAQPPRAFISLDAMLRGPQVAEAHSCGPAGCGPDACVCGEH